MVEAFLSEREQDRFARVIPALGCQLDNATAFVRNIMHNGTQIGTIERTPNDPRSDYRVEYNSGVRPMEASVLASKKGTASDKINSLAMQFYGQQNHEVLEGIYVTNPAGRLTAFYDESGGTLYRVDNGADAKAQVKLAEQLADGVGKARGESSKPVTASDVTALTSRVTGAGASTITYDDMGQCKTVIYDIQHRRGREDKARILAIVEVPAGGQGYVNQDALKETYNVQLSSYEMSSKERKAQSSGQGSGSPSSGNNNNNNNNNTPMSDNAKHGWAGVAAAGVAVAATTWASRTQRDRQEVAAMEGRPERKGGMLQFVKVVSVALATTALAVTLDASLNKGRAFDAVKNTLTR